MSCKMSGSCESDAEPVSRLKDVGRPKPPKRPASRHVVNPNFMFFCQIVLLVIPITVLFAGLYFMNISSPVIVLICGAIIFIVLCIFVFVRPFKEEKCEVKNPLKRSYEYSPLKLTPDADPMRTERPKPQKRLSLLRDEDADEEEDDECPPQIKHVSTDTLLSIGTSDLSEVATQGRSVTEVPKAAMVTSEDGRCRCCQMGCRGPKSREDEAVFKENLRQQKQSLQITMQESDRCTWETRGYSVQTDQVSPPNSLGVTEEERDTTRPDSLISPSPCSEEMYRTAKLLLPDVALSDTTRQSIPTSHTVTSLPNNASYSDNTQHPNQSQASDRRLGYTTQESSFMTSNRRAKSPPKSPRKTKSPQRFEQKTFTERPSCVSDQSNIENCRNKRDVTRTDVACENRLCPFEFRNHKDNFMNHPSPPISSTSTYLPQKVGRQFPKSLSQDFNHKTDMPNEERAVDPFEVECTNKLCPFVPKNQPQHQIDSKISSLQNNSFENYPLKTSPEKPVKSKKKRGFIEDSKKEEEKLTARGKQNIFEFDTQNDSPRKSVKDPEFQAVKFQLCPSEEATNDRCSPTGQNRTKQPILIKLFPTSSKDGVFSWEANPVKPNGVGNTSANNIQRTFPNSPLQSRTADECVQTTAPEMVDTQTSAVFPTSERSVHYSVPKVKDSMATQGNPMHQNSSGSVVDFVLRPFSKVVKSVATRDKKSRTDKVESSRRSKQSGNMQEPQKITETNDSSKFDLLKIQSPSKKENHERNQRGKGNKPKSPDNKEKSPRKERTAKLDICSIYYSSIQGKLYQPTRSGLLVTESSKEEVDKPQEAVKWQRIENANAEADGALDKYKNKVTSPRHHRRDNFNLEATQKQTATAETKRITRTKRKSDDEGKTKPKCARHDGSWRQSRQNDSVRDETSLPWQGKTENIANARPLKDSEPKDKITFMFPPFNLDFSSGPCDEDSKVSSSNPKCHHEPEKSACKKLSTDHRVSKKPQSPEKPNGSKSKNQKISHHVQTTLFRKSSSYENVVIEKVIKQKKRTLKKFK